MALYIIHAEKPTLLDGHKSFELIPTDLMVSYVVDTAHVFPGTIDIPRFNKAVSQTLSSFPLAVGRISRAKSPGQPWKILLVDQGLPVTVVDSDAEKIVAKDSIVQSPFPFLVDRVNASRFFKESSEEPLVKITVTQYTKLGYTSIGVSYAHVIGDGFTVAQFTRLLSQHYQGLPPLDDPPNYSWAFSYQPTDESALDIPCLRDPYHINTIPPFMDPAREKAIRVDIHFTAEQIGRIHKAISTQPNAENCGTTPISRQDALVALLAKCYTESEPSSPPVTKISNVFMHRGISSCPPTRCCNAFVFALGDVTSELDKGDHPPSLFALAQSVRQSLQQPRDPQFFARLQNQSNQRFQEIADSDMCVDLTPGPGEMVINSTWKFDYTSAHFGYPGKTRFFHTILSEPRFIKIFRPNPTLLPDGTWTRPDPRDAEITLFVRRQTLTQFEEVLRGYLTTFGITEGYQFFSYLDSPLASADGLSDLAH
ncbi:Acyltransferase [Abortiporus biennis]